MKLKTAALAGLVLYLSMFMSGCAMFLDQLKNDKGELMFRNKTTLEVVAESEIPAGRADDFEPVWSGKPGPALSTLGAVLGIVGGPWGAVAASGVAAVAGLGAAVANKRKLNVAAAGQEAAMSGMGLAVSIIEDIKEGKVDLDENGKIDQAEIKAYVAKRAKDALKPEFFEEVVRIITSSLPDAEKKAALAGLRA